MFYIDAARCAGCGTCIEYCPEAAISLRQGVAVIDGAVCRDCGICQNVCPNDAPRLLESAPVAPRFGATDTVSTPYVRSQLLTQPMPSPTSAPSSPFAFISRSVRRWFGDSPRRRSATPGLAYPAGPGKRHRRRGGRGLDRGGRGRGLGIARGRGL